LSRQPAVFISPLFRRHSLSVSLSDATLRCAFADIFFLCSLTRSFCHFRDIDRPSSTPSTSDARHADAAAFAATRCRDARAVPRYGADIQQEAAAGARVAHRGAVDQIEQWREAVRQVRRDRQRISSLLSPISINSREARLTPRCSCAVCLPLLMLFFFFFFFTQCAA